MSNNVVNEPIVGLVARIINERELAINIGSKNGVLGGMKFSVMAKDAIEVHDPETNEKLGVVDREKVRVMANEVRERFSICKTYREWVSGPAAMVDINRFLGISAVRKGKETLKVDDSSLPPPLSEEESYVKIGDRVIQIEEADS